MGNFKMVILNTLVIRVDSNSKIGLGHVMRCRAFAQAWARQGGHSIFVMADPSPIILKRLVSENIQVENLVNLKMCFYIQQHYLKIMLLHFRL